MNIELNHVVSGSGIPVLFLHGFLGSHTNLLSLSRPLSRNYCCILADQRNHGNSPHVGGLSYQQMAGDAIALLDYLGYEKVFIIGHSMGAKTAMEIALAYPHRVRGLIALDASPAAHTPRYAEIVHLLEEIDLSMYVTRKELEQLFTSRGIELGLARFVLKNVVHGKSGFEWKINISAIVTHYLEVWKGIAVNRLYEGPVLFLKAEKSDFIGSDDYQLIKKLFPRSEIKVVHDAGHWLHAEQAEECLRLIDSFFASIVQ